MDTALQVESENNESMVETITGDDAEFCCVINAIWSATLERIVPHHMWRLRKGKMVESGYGRILRYY